MRSAGLAAFQARRVRTMKPFKPKVRGWALVVWGAGLCLLVVAAILWIFGDTYRNGTTVAYLVPTAIGLNFLSMALSRRRDRTPATGSRRP
jgi:hypothetical protein